LLAGIFCSQLKSLASKFLLASSRLGSAERGDAAEAIDCLDLGTIRVQPTALARRREGVTRGSKRVAAGRPAQGVGNAPKKRKRNLMANVASNQANAKSHGVNH